MQKPKATRVSASGKYTAKYSRGKLGEPLNVPSAEFDLTDFNLKQSCGNYNCFNDPMLKKFFRQPERKKQLLKHRLITQDEKVLCSLKEFNQYTKYVKSVQQSWNKLLLKEQKLLLKDFMLQQMEGKIPDNISFDHMRETLILESKSMFRTMFKKVLKPGQCLYDSEREWERIQRLQLEMLTKEIIRELRAEGRFYLEPLGSNTLVAAMYTHDRASAHKGQAFSTIAEQITNKKKKKKRAGDRAMSVKDLQDSKPKLAILTEERDSSSQVAKKLVSRVLRNIQDSTNSEHSLSETSSSEIQSFSGSCTTSPWNLDSESQTDSPTTKVAVDLVKDALTKIQNSPSSDLSLMDLEMSSDSLRASRSCSHVRPYFDAQIGSPTSEVTVEIVSGVLRKIQDSSSSDLSLMDLEMSSDSLRASRTSSHVRSCLDARTVSPTSKAAMCLVRDALRKIQDSSSSDLTLTDLEMSSDSLRASRTSSHVRSCWDAQTVSPTSKAAMCLVRDALRKIQDSSSSDLTLTDLEMSSDSLRASRTSSHVKSCWDAQTVSPTSKAAMCLVRDALRKIQDSSSSDLTLTDLEMSSDSLRASRTSSHIRSCLDAQIACPTSEVAVELVSDVLRKVKNSPSSDLSSTDLEMSSDSLRASRTSSHIRACLDAQVVSPTSEVTVELVSDVLREIQDSSRSGLGLLEIPSNEASQLQSRLPHSPTSSPKTYGSDTEISSASEISRNLVKSVLRSIQELPNSDCNLLDSHSACSSSSDSDAQLVSPNSEATIKLVSDILRTIDDSPGSDLSVLDSAPTSENNSTGKKKNSKARNYVFAFFSRSWKTLRQIFTNARCSNRISVL